MIVGFTGTRGGMTEMQKRVVLQLVQVLHANGYIRYIHGGCMGADWDFHLIATSNPYRAEVRVHPSTIYKTYPAAIRALCQGKKPTDEVVRSAWLRNGATFVASPDAALARNTTMMRYVSECQGAVIATPLAGEPESRSGTWHAIRSAQHFKIQPLYLVLPDGTVQ